MSVDLPGRLQTLAAATAEAVDPDVDLGGVEAVDPMAPSRPTKIVCLGRNYRRHAEELGNPIPEEPLIFLKPPSAVVGSGTGIVFPAQSDEIHHEAELAVVVAKRCHEIAPEDVDDVLAGYTCANDVTARDIQRREGKFTRGKGFDTFCPLGPCLVPPDAFEPDEHQVVCRVDGDERQRCGLDDFIFSIPEAVAFISEVMTLQPGDVVLTGTPAGVGPLEVGERVEVEIDGIGTLSNPVVSHG